MTRMEEALKPRVFNVTVNKVKDLGNDTRHFELSYDPGETMDFTSGQFVSVLHPRNGKTIRRSYSIASLPSLKDRFDLCLKLVPKGVVSSWFWTFRGGEHFQVQGPLGKFILPGEIDFDIVFVATGTGVAPFRSMIPHLLQNGFQRNMWLLFGVRYGNMIPYDEEWLELAKRYRNFTYIPTVSRPDHEWLGETGYVQTKIETFFPSPDGKRVYICGVNQMVQAVQDACFKQGFKKEQVHYERYT